jgi:hypothetical protein
MFSEKFQNEILKSYFYKKTCNSLLEKRHIRHSIAHLNKFDYTQNELMIFLRKSAKFLKIFLLIFCFEKLNLNPILLF